MSARNRTGDHLGAMYIIAALLMCLASLFVVLMMFVPSDWRDRFGQREVYVPGSIPAFEPLARANMLATQSPGTREVAPGRFEVTMTAYNWEFFPKEIRVPAGSHVTIRATSMEDYHGVMIIGTDILLSLKQHEPSEASHTFAEAGEYLFVCSEYCGAGHGYMIGRVIVE